MEYLHKKSIPLSDQEVYDQVSDWLKTDAEYIYYVKSPSIHLSLYQTFGGSNFKFLYNPTLMREKYGTDDPVKVAKAQEVERCIEYRSHVEHSIRSRDRSTLSAVNILLENDQETKVLEDIGQFFENALGKSMIMPSDKDGNSRFYDRITDRDLLLTLEALSNQIIRKIYSLRERIEKNSANKHE